VSLLQFASESSHRILSLQRILISGAAGTKIVVEDVAEHEGQRERLSRWRRADDLEYQFAAVERLAEALRRLHLAAFPKMGSSLGKVSSAGAGWSDEVTPDLARKKYRGKLRSILRQVDELGFAALNAAEDRQPPEPRRGWRCSQCRRGQRAGAAFCDRCGVLSLKQSDVTSMGSSQNSR
jgi:hypothetical protein